MKFVRNFFFKPYYVTCFFSKALQNHQNLTTECIPKKSAKINRKDQHLTFIKEAQKGVSPPPSIRIGLID